MTPATPDDPRATFEYFSNEYAEALQAFQAIETQASTLMVMGYTGDLKNFLEQFLEMATRARDQAIEKNEKNFAEWFDELVKKAENLRSALRR
ncbi:MAG TPA: hypothetical protein VJZ00_02925 [Thermoanaerobaculia bacterium]|nr:hypothetical protein [Thermoanaerobaculia bacterium]